MAIFETGAYQVKASAVPKVEAAIREFVGWLRDNEPGTRMYLAWREKDDPTRFLHLFRFEDEAARSRHGKSDAVRRFESVYSPELVKGGVTFTQYEQVAGNQEARGVVEKFYDAVIRRDLTEARRYLSGDLVFKGLFETYQGPDAYLNALAGLLSITVRLEVKTILGQGEEASIFFELETKAPAQGTVLVAEWHRLQGGKIARVDSAFDGRPYAAMFTGARS